MQLIIRRAVIKDFPHVQKLYYELFILEQHRDPFIHTSWPLEKAGEQFLSRIITGIDTVCFIAEVNDNPVGFLIGTMLTNDPIRPCKRSQLISIYVEKIYRDQTIGTHLIEKFITWSLEKKAEKISVIVQHDNIKGLSFYKNLKFHNHLFVLEKDL